MEDVVRSTFGCQTPESSLESGRSCPSQQETSRVQEIVFTRLDRGSVCGVARDAGSRSHLQDPRMGRDATDRDVLRGRFTESDGAGRRLISHRKDRQTKRG